MAVVEQTTTRQTRQSALRVLPPVRQRVAYIMSRFPRLTETFVLYEMIALEHEGFAVELFPLLRERAALVQPDAVPFVERAHYQPFLSGAILAAHVRCLARQPKTYLQTLWAMLRGTWGSLNFFVGGLGIFPKTVYFAEQMAALDIPHVHAHFASHPALAGFIIRRLTGIPYSFTAHGSDLHVDRTMLRAKVAEAAFVVAVSTYNKEMIVAECGEEFRDKIVVIHCGVDRDVFQPPAERRDDPSAPLQILCIGTLHEVKGQTYLIEACRILKQQGIAFECHLVGDGEDRAALTAQIAQAGLADAVRLHGKQPRDVVARLLGAADVVVTPSVPTRSGKREGIPVVLMEAMGSGLPVVASDLSGIPELVENEESGLLVPPRDAPAIARALVRLHGDPALRRRLGAAARDKVLREFDLHTNALTLAGHFNAKVQP